MEVYVVSSFWSGVVEGGRARVSCEAVQGSPPLVFSWSNINQTGQHILISQVNRRVNVD